MRTESSIASNVSSASVYSEQFKTRVVDAFIAYFQASTGLTAAAVSAAQEFNIAASTVRTWAEQQRRTPTPTWGEIRRLRAQNAIMASRLTTARSVESAGSTCPHCGGDLG